MKSYGEHVKVDLENPIGENTPLFSLPIDDAKIVDVNLEKVVYINSAGVRNWIFWTVRIPKKCQVNLHHSPFVVVTQASSVMGFLTPQIKIMSFRAPYLCGDCEHELTETLVQGRDYYYSAPMSEKRINIRKNISCPKCRGTNTNADFEVDKTFRFLS